MKLIWNYIYKTSQMTKILKTNWTKIKTENIKNVFEICIKLYRWILNKTIQNINKNSIGKYKTESE